MAAKFTVKDAANLLRIEQEEVVEMLEKTNSPFKATKHGCYFNHLGAKKIFKLKFRPKVVTFQIIKGGVGKTTLAHEFAVRANLYGAKVLCIDLDQQGNLTQSFKVDAEDFPIMVDVITNDYKLNEIITPVNQGLDLICSRIENAVLDEAILSKKMSLDTAYNNLLAPLKKDYDLIVVDCPPSLGSSVVSTALASDIIIAPVLADNYALSGLKASCKAMNEMQRQYSTQIPLGAVINKYDSNCSLSQQAYNLIKNHPNYNRNLLKTKVRLSKDFAKAVACGMSIFDSMHSSNAQKDIDNLTKEILGIDRQINKVTRDFQVFSQMNTSLLD